MTVGGGLGVGVGVEVPVGPGVAVGFEELVGVVLGAAPPGGTTVGGVAPESEPADVGGDGTAD